MVVGDIFAGVRIVEPAAIHKEFVFITPGRQGQALLPQARVRIADHPQTGRVPVIEIAANVNVFRPGAFQHKINIVAG